VLADMLDVRKLLGNIDGGGDGGSNRRGIAPSKYFIHVQLSHTLDHTNTNYSQAETHRIKSTSNVATVGAAVVVVTGLAVALATVESGVATALVVVAVVVAQVDVGSSMVLAHTAASLALVMASADRTTRCVVVMATVVAVLPRYHYHCYYRCCCCCCHCSVEYWLALHRCYCSWLVHSVQSSVSSWCTLLIGHRQTRHLTLAAWCCPQTSSRRQSMQQHRPFV
jgi:cell division protein FtsW (lipid II flippase)